MSSTTDQKTIELIFSLFPFDAIVYPNPNYGKKMYGVVSVYVILSRLPPFCVFNVVVNDSIYYPNIVVVFSHDILSLYYIFTVGKPFSH